MMKSNLPRDITQFEAQTGLNFHDHNLLQMAFIHSSYVNESDDPTMQDNERLEFLGDSILGYLVSEMLYVRFSDVAEGELTSMRAALVRRETLARYARQLHLGDYLWLGHGEEESGGRKRVATLCATFEAVVGAIYLDLGLEAVRAFLQPVIEADMERVQRSAVQKDAKSRLQEWAQSNLGASPKYQVVNHRGPDHDKVFITEVTIHKVRYGIGQGRSKQEASQAAAMVALAQLGQEELDSVPEEELLASWPVAQSSKDGQASENGQANDVRDEEDSSTPADTSMA